MPHLRPIARLHHLPAYQPPGFVVLIVSVVLLGQPSGLPVGQPCRILRKPTAGVAILLFGVNGAPRTTAQYRQQVTVCDAS
ncbi:hypothetical protein [Pectobacterium parmentieri]|uniref:hypothetical protein n=1 Tax=Pectobacterium parmentieri TaxID=1905730 RepID=UPI001E30D664|nr:hypothetical protein [Pectobacterium parmentieri]